MDEGSGRILGAEGKKVTMEIRNAVFSDWKALAEIERACFPAEEAASGDSICIRLACFPDHFWLLSYQGRIVSFVDGMVTEKKNLTDEVYERPAMHQEDGALQMLFFVNPLPGYRQKSRLGAILKRTIAEAKRQGRKGLVLTCKEALIPYYAKFGFVNEGISESVHGGAVWYQMRLELNNEKD